MCCTLPLLFCFGRLHLAVGQVRGHGAYKHLCIAHVLPAVCSWVLTWWQAEEEAARKEAEDLAANPVKRVRKLALSGAAPKEVIAELGSIDAEGGQIGRTSILYEVRLLTY